MPTNPNAVDQALGALVEPGYRLALTMLGDPGLAEDAVQDAAMRAWRKLSSLRDGRASRQPAG